MKTESLTQIPALNPVARGRQQQAERVREAKRAAKLKRRTSAQNIQSHKRTVAAGLSLVENPNRAKHHAARMDNSARETFRQYAPGAPVKERRFRHIETRWQGTPSLPGILSKRPLNGESRG